MTHSLALGGHFDEAIPLARFGQGCCECHTCQVVGKNQLVPPVVPLKPIPAFGEPFSRVIVDCVGPEQELEMST